MELLSDIAKELIIRLTTDLIAEIITNWPQQGVSVKIAVLSQQPPATGGGDVVEYLIAFGISVAAGIVANYISKRLDGEDNSDNQP